MTSNFSIPASSFGGTPFQTEERPLVTPKTTTVATPSNDLHPCAVDKTAAPMAESVESEGGVGGNQAARKKISTLLKGKEEEWTAVAQKKGPLQLLDLPMDVLKEIVKEVTHTNDLTALALTHSALHNLAIPHIYSRFDIVWPDATSTTDTRTGVDALTYGLATLVMGHEVFGQRVGQRVGSDPSLGKSATCSTCGGQSTSSVIAKGTAGGGQRRIGNNYPQFTRKFSLGNGPADWVQEYLITKESGKMLGTLVALAVARMVNLETFIWDMPTGILRDVWLALSSLQDKSPPGECRLERVLVRWHDNSMDQAPSPSRSNSNTTSAVHHPAGGTVTPIGIMLPPESIPTPHNLSLSHNSSHNRVEYPTLSVLPPLKSLSVVDIDELAYLDEMSILIEKSKDRLQELRVGISKKAQDHDFVLAWDGPGLQQVDHNARWPGAPSSIGNKRLGGVLGILLGRVFDIRKKSKLVSRPKHRVASLAADSIKSPGLDTATQQDSHTASIVVTESTAPIEEHVTAVQEAPDMAQVPENSILDQISVESPDTPISSVVLPFAKLDDQIQENESENQELNVSATITSPGLELSQPQLSHAPPHDDVQPVALRIHPGPGQATPTIPCNREHLNGMLKLRVLELERVPLSIVVLQKAFDWSMITSLTILDCAYHESLWRMLRRHFQPQATTPAGLSRQSMACGKSKVSMEYQLHLKKIHTDVATPALIAFLKETLAPNTLEVLFLQDRRKNTASSVTIDAIYRGPLRRHRRSLQKLLIDSSDKTPRGPNSSSDSTRWRTWMLTHDVLEYIVSGNMSNLRELSVAIDYKDWHFFLRRLEQIPTLRSLNIPFIADHVTPGYDPRELAMQVVDMIYMRPEIELCYLGISNKCFEILENRPHDDAHPSLDLHGSGTNAGHTTDEDEDEDADASDEDVDEDDEEDEDEENDDGTATEAVEVDGIEYDTSDLGDSDAESSDGSDDDRSKVSLRLREILFYDDKVAIFKARHMRL